MFNEIVTTLMFDVSPLDVLHGTHPRTTINLGTALKPCTRQRQDVKAVVTRVHAAGPDDARSRSRLGAVQVASARRGFLPGIDPLKLNQLVDELEMDEFLERPHGRGRKPA